MSQTAVSQTAVSQTAGPQTAGARIAVAGGTGNVGRHVVAALRGAGHEAVVLSRASGMDLMTGHGLDDALADATAVVDVLNTPAVDPDGVRAFFGTTTRNLLAAEERAGVRHHVLLSIVGVDRVQGNVHYEGKRLQEELVTAAPVPGTIVRATQFHDFAAMVVGWTRREGAATVAPLLVQPVAPSDVGDALARIALGSPAGTVELAGPGPQDLVDMARRTLAARGDAIRLIPTWRGLFGPEMAGEVLLPGPDAMLAPTTFEQWLATEGRATHPG
ncbi:MAG: SDR family oxidoreductase [Streptosporangiaceae bacterium]